MLAGHWTPGRARRGPAAAICPCHSAHASSGNKNDKKTKNNNNNTNNNNSGGGWMRDTLCSFSLGPFASSLCSRFLDPLLVANGCLLCHARFTSLQEPDCGRAFRRMARMRWNSGVRRREAMANGDLKKGKERRKEGTKKEGRIDGRKKGRTEG